MFDLSKATVSISCPECHFSNSVRIGDVKMGKRIICSGCHCYIYLIDKDASTHRSDKRVNTAFKRLEEELSKLNCNLTTRP